MASVPNQVVQLPFINHQSSSKPFTSYLSPLGKFPDDPALLVAVLRKLHLGLFLEGNDGFTDSDVFQEARLFTDSDVFQEARLC
ncbi:MAG: hypothetical protein AB2693_30485 [Candidatus Thiodiazotropha sp.]